jgi:SAM-dependent methyltransferase
MLADTKTFYDAVARKHQLFYADWPAAMEQEASWLDTLFKPLGIRTVLACTCGIGTQAVGLALRGYEVTASDLSAANLAEAQRHARSYGVAIAWHQADVRYLDQVSMAGPFDAVISVGNSLPHLLDERDLQAALGQMADHTKPGGLVIVGQRDWDTFSREQPSFRFRHQHPDTPSPGQRTVVFDLIHYDDPLITMEVFFLQGPMSSSNAIAAAEEAWQTEVLPLRYRMWQRRELIEFMEEAGLHDVHQVDHAWELRLTGRKPSGFSPS